MIPAVMNMLESGALTISPHKKILCIEDEAHIRKDIVEELQEAGYETIEVANGMEGLNAIKEHMPDLVLCDINMPEMSGFELLKEVRGNHLEFAYIPFVFLSALADHENVITSKQLGCDDFLSKPIDYERMLATIQTLLTKKSHPKESKQDEMDELRESIMWMLPHELHTPLNQIIEFAEMIKGQVHGPIVNDQYLDYARHIQEAGAHLLETVEGTLSLVAVSSGGIAPNMCECNIAKLIGDCEEEASKAAKQQHIKLLTKLPEHLHPIQTDAEILRHAISALLSNAIKFTPPEGTIQLAASTNLYGGFSILVSDTGIGFADEDIHEIFKPFSQARGGNSRNFDGAGIGLPLAKALTELLEGSLELQSEVGSGTTVILRFR